MSWKSEMGFLFVLHMSTQDYQLHLYVSLRNFETFPTKKAGSTFVAKFA